jgi:hypothetical protein
MSYPPVVERLAHIPAICIVVKIAMWKLTNCNAFERPVRYTHAHNGILNRRDFDQMVELVVAMLKRLDAGEVRRIRDFAPDGR